MLAAIYASNLASCSSTDEQKSDIVGQENISSEEEKVEDLTDFEGATDTESIVSNNNAEPNTESVVESNAELEGNSEFEGIDTKELLVDEGANPDDSTQFIDAIENTDGESNDDLLGETSNVQMETLPEQINNSLNVNPLNNSIGLIGNQGVNEGVNGNILVEDNELFDDEPVAENNTNGSTNNASTNDASPNENIPAEEDVLPTRHSLSWVGYEYSKENRALKVEMITKGNPEYKIFSEKNQAGQLEYVVRFYQTALRRKVKWDIDASEFRSPVAYIRMRENSIEGVSDVVLTMRSQVNPKFFAKDGNVVLKFDIPDSYFGNETIASAKPDEKAQELQGNGLAINIEQGSDLPKDEKQAALGFQAPEAISNAIDEQFEDLPSQNGQNALVNDTNFLNSGAIDNLPADNLNSGINANLNQAAILDSIDIGNNSNGTNNVGTMMNNLSNTNDAANTNSVNELPANNTFPEQDVDSDVLNNEDFDDLDSVEHIKDVFPDHEYVIESYQLGAVAQDDLEDEDLGGNEFGFDAGEDNFNNASNTFDAEPNISAEGNGFDQNAKQVSNQAAVGVPVNNASSNPSMPNPADPAVSAPVNTATTDAAFPSNNVASDAAAQDAISADVSNAPKEVEIVDFKAEENIVMDNGFSDLVDLPAKDIEGQSGTNTPEEFSGEFLTLDFYQAPLSSVFAVLTEETGNNFIYPQEIAERLVTITFKKVPWDKALKAILETFGLGMINIGDNLVRVDTVDNLTQYLTKVEQARNLEARRVPTKILVMRLNNAKAAEMVERIGPILARDKQLDNRVQIAADVRTNSLVLEAPEYILAKVQNVVNRLDLETPQVEITSRIVEVKKDNNNIVGMSILNRALANFDPGRGLGFGTLNFPNSVLSTFSVDPAIRGQAQVGSAQFRIGSINKVIDLDLILKLEERRGTTNVLQRNRVLVLDNETANILSGESKFFNNAIVGGNEGEAAGMSEVKFNLELKVKPQVTADGAVLMDLNINSDTPGDTTGNEAAAKNSRELNTKMLRNSGDTGVIGGIVNTQVTEAQIGIPFISRLPIIGALFRRTSKTESQTELLIMVTPKILGRGSSQDTSGGDGLDDFGGTNVSNFDNGFGGSNIATNVDNGLGGSNGATNVDNGLGGSNGATNVDNGLGGFNDASNVDNGLGGSNDATNVDESLEGGSDNVVGTNVSNNIDNEFGGNASGADTLDTGSEGEGLGPENNELGIDTEDL